MTKNKLKFYLIFIIFPQLLLASSIGVFGGFGTPENISKILTGNSRYPIKSKAAMMGVSGQYPVLEISKRVRLKIEGQLIQHFTLQKCQEITLAPLLEISNIFDTQTYQANLSIGDGISSLIGSKPRLEARKQKPRRTLNYFLLDLAFTQSPEAKQEVFMRLHHRCHFFKAIAPKGTGSNFFLVGVRFKI